MRFDDYSWWFFTKPSEKYGRQIGSSPQGAKGENKKYLKFHHRFDEDEEVLPLKIST